MKADEAMLMIVAEYKEASEKHDKLNSSHEGYAVIKEELDELWDEVKKKGSVRSVPALRGEAMQVAAMALRFMVDLC